MQLFCPPKLPPGEQLLEMGRLSIFALSMLSIVVDDVVRRSARALNRSLATTFQGLMMFILEIPDIMKNTNFAHLINYERYLLCKKYMNE